MKLSIGAKILLGFGLALLIQSAVGGVSYWATTALIHNAERVTHTHEVLESLEALLSLLKDAETGQRGFLLTGADDYLKPYRDSTRLIATRLKDLQALASTNRGQQHRLALLEPLINGKLEELEQTITLRKGPNGEVEARKVVLSNKGKEAMDQIRGVIDEMQQEEHHLLQERARTASSYATLSTRTTLFGTLLAFVLVSLAGLVIYRSITVPLTAFMRFVERVGTGDLTRQAPASSGDEVGRLGANLNEMVAGLRDLAGQAGAGTANLNSASSEILAAVQQQAAGSRQQAAAIQQITTTVEEVSRSGSQIAEKAREVAASAEATASTTTAGLQAVQAATRAMEALREQVEAAAQRIAALGERTQAIGEIIATVNDVAERSNLLALNAAIEAAGAGEAGARFGVVAAEMKNLADQAKESTVQVQTILGAVQKGITASVLLTEEAVKRAAAGREQAQATERVIDEMAEMTQQSIQAFQQIIAATGQQQIGLDQVTQGMKDIRQAARQTADTTAQLEQAVANVSALSQQLQKAVGRYKL